MSQEFQPPFRSFNHDRMAFGAFRAPVYTVRQSHNTNLQEGLRAPVSTGVAAAALPLTAAPSPTHLTDAQAESIVETVQSSALLDSDEMLQAHSLDPDRVARLLGLLE